MGKIYSGICTLIISRSKRCAAWDASSSVLTKWLKSGLASNVEVAQLGKRFHLISRPVYMQWRRTPSMRSQPYLQDSPTLDWNLQDSPTLGWEEPHMFFSSRVSFTKASSARFIDPKSFSCCPKMTITWIHVLHMFAVKIEAHTMPSPWLKSQRPRQHRAAAMRMERPVSVPFPPARGLGAAGVWGEDGKGKMQCFFWIVIGVHDFISDLQSGVDSLKHKVTGYSWIWSMIFWVKMLIW